MAASVLQQGAVERPLAHLEPQCQLDSCLGSVRLPVASPTAAPVALQTIGQADAAAILDVDPGKTL